MAIKRLPPLVRGDSSTISLAVASSGSPFPLKNCVIHYTMKSDASLPDSEAALQKIVTSFHDSTCGTSAVNGIAQIDLSPADTAALDPGDYDFDIQLTTALGQAFTVMIGKREVIADVTRTVGTAGTAA